MKRLNARMLNVSCLNVPKKGRMIKGRRLNTREVSQEISGGEGLLARRVKDLEHRAPGYLRPLLC